jgi:hypothetical protein
MAHLSVGVVLTMLLLDCLTTLALPTTDRTGSIEWGSCGTSLDQLLPPGTDDFPLPIECANFTVPLDYTCEDAGELDLNLVRVRALQQPSQASILFNPGGPGHLGIEYVALRGDDLME